MRESLKGGGQDHPDQIPASWCPKCGYVMDAATHASPGPPRPAGPGDFSICLNCGEWLQFNDILVLELLPAESLPGLDPRTRHLMTKAREIILLRGRLH